MKKVALVSLVTLVSIGYASEVGSLPKKRPELHKTEKIICELEPYLATSPERIRGITWAESRGKYSCNSSKACGVMQIKPTTAAGGIEILYSPSKRYGGFQEEPILTAKRDYLEKRLEDNYFTRLRNLSLENEKARQAIKDGFKIYDRKSRIRFKRSLGKLKKQGSCSLEEIALIEEQPKKVKEFVKKIRGKNNDDLNILFGDLIFSFHRQRFKSEAYALGSYNQGRKAILKGEEKFPWKYVQKVKQFTPKKLCP